MNPSQIRYYQKNKEKILEQKRQDYKKNRDKKIAYQRQYRLDNVEKMKAYRLKNREKKIKQHKKWYENNPNYYKERYLEKRRYIKNYKISKGCAICGYNKCASALDFHHNNNSDKKFSISQFNDCGIKKIKNEMDKCIVLCRNCHAELHERERENGS